MGRRSSRSIAPAGLGLDDGDTARSFVFTSYSSFVPTHTHMHRCALFLHVRQGCRPAGGGHSSGARRASFGLLLFLWIAAATALPICPTLQLQVKSSRRSLKPGLSVVLTAKVTNMGAAAVNRVGVQLDLPPALVPYTDPKSTKGPLIVN